nr:uncharacterized protein LOC127335300 isoform X1 [Lolium perenne]
MRASAAGFAGCIPVELHMRLGRTPRPNPASMVINFPRPAPPSASAHAPVATPPADLPCDVGGWWEAGATRSRDLDALSDPGSSRPGGVVPNGRSCSALPDGRTWTSLVRDDGVDQELGAVAEAPRREHGHLPAAGITLRREFGAPSGPVLTAWRQRRRVVAALSQLSARPCRSRKRLPHIARGHCFFFNSELCRLPPVASLGHVLDYVLQ